MSALVLRTCRADMTSHDGFRWPESGPVEAPNWNPEPICGGGLHGLLWGEGDGSLLCWEPDAKWLVVRVEAWVDLIGKVKFPRGEVLFAGERDEATRRVVDGGMCRVRTQELQNLSNFHLAMRKLVEASETSS